MIFSGRQRVYPRIHLPTMRLDEKSYSIRRHGYIPTRYDRYSPAAAARSGFDRRIVRHVGVAPALIEMLPEAIARP